MSDVQVRTGRKPVIADNSDESLYGLDAVLTYGASESGVHEIEVGCLDPLATAYQFEVDLAVAHCAGVPG
jgi:hypothetical protein